MMLSSRSNLPVANNTTLELQQDLARSTPQQCVTLTHSVPSVQMYCALRTKLEQCSERWLQEFLYLDGLDSLLGSLYQMSTRGFTCISDAILQMDCISCIRCILNSTFGLEFFINSDTCTKKLTMALNSNETLPKKQVFEILSAVCVFNNIGYLRVMEGLSYVKNECDQLHRFSIIVRELQKGETVAFKTAVMMFVNTLINCTPTVTERIRIRNEFIGLNMLETLTYIRREEPDQDLLLQLEVFHERKMSDEESISANNSIDLNSPQDLQEKIQARVFGTPKMANFVNILQDLLAIETVYKDKSDKLWPTVDNLVHHVIHTMSTCDFESIQFELRQMPEQFGLGLQCVFSYQDTLKMQAAHPGPTQVLMKAAHPGPTQVLMQAAHPGPTQVLSSLPSMTNPANNDKTKLNQLATESCYKNANKYEMTGQKNFKQNDNCRNIASVKGENSNPKGRKEDSLGSAGSRSPTDTSGNSANNRHSFYDNSDTQNRTVTIVKHEESSMAAGQVDSSATSGINDKTVVLSRKFCSPTDLTFFSNKLDTTEDSPLNNCSKMSSEDPCSPYDADLSCSISSKLSRESNRNATFNKAEESYKCGMNINLSESKAYEYEQDKMKNKLDSFYECLQEEFQAEERSFKEAFNKLSQCQSEMLTDGPSMSQEKLGFREMLLREKSGFREMKRSNSIDRPFTPKPSKKLQHLKWITLNDERIAGREPCIWLPPLHTEKTTPDYKKLETAFQVVSPDTVEAVEEVVLLNASTRLKINLFLSRLDSGAEDLVQHLQDGNQSKLTLPMLQYISKILPCQEEIVMLRQYKGPRLELGMAEQFVLLLSDLPDYAILLEGHMMSTEFEATVSQFKTSLDTMIKMSKLILHSTEFKELMHLILRIGNYLNYGQYHGSAAGFRVSSLERLQEVKCGAPNHNLVHVIIQMMKEKDKSSLSFVEDFLALEKATSFSMEDMKADISKLNGKLRCFMNNLTQASTKLQTAFQPFIESLKREFGSIQSATTELRNLTDQLATYFCEDETRFNIQDCFKSVISFCKDLQKCQNESVGSFCRQQLENKQSGIVMQKKLKSKLLSLEFGQNAGASSSMMEEKTKVLEKIVTQLHQGNFNPCIKSQLSTPDRELDCPLEMSCIPFVGSPASRGRGRLGTGVNDNVFVDTPELVCASYGSDNVPKMTRSSTRKLRPLVTTCTAQTAKPFHSSTKNCFMPSPITSDAGNPGKKSVTLHRKLFPLKDGNEVYQERGVDVNIEDGKVRRQIELPGKKTMHRRSRSDMVDSLCGANKWIEYEKTREQGDRNAPLAEPESICNLSILNLENRGKFVTNKDIVALKSGREENKDLCSLENGPMMKMPDQKDRKAEKKSAVGGFFSKLGRAVLKQRNVYSDGDHHDKTSHKDVKERKMSVSSDKENNDSEQLAAYDKNGKQDALEYKRYKSEGNTNKVSRFLRGGLYRSSKMKKKNLNVAQ